LLTVKLSFHKMVASVPDIPQGQLTAQEQQEAPLYVCSVCGETVILFNGRPFYTCACEDRQIVLTEEGMKRGL
jgi:hypothetical protein